MGRGRETRWPSHVAGVGAETAPLRPARRNAAGILGTGLRPAPTSRPILLCYNFAPEVAMRPDLMRAVQAFQDDIVRFAQKLIQTPSLSGAEGPVAALTEREMERLGYDRTWRDEVGNVIGLMQGAGGGKSVMLNSHLDHVDVGDQSQWEFPPYAAVVADDFI